MDVPWQELEACGGHADATQIPEAIDLLFSPDSGKRQAGYWKIDNCAVVQSDLYSSAPYAAYLVVQRLAGESEAPLEVLDILQEIYNGSNPSVLEVGPLAGESIELLCRRIVREAEPVLRNLVETSSGESRDGILELLESFTEEKR